MADILLLSGGIDSTTLLAEMVVNGTKFSALTFDYGQRHAERELASAREHTEKFGVTWNVQKLDLKLSSSLTKDSAILPTSKAEKKDSTYVPARNTWMVALAASRMERGRVWIGCNEEDAVAYPDCTPEWLRSMNQTLKLGGMDVTVEAPYIMLTKRAVVGLAWAYGVNVKKTWSCYRGEAKPCGRCGACDVRSGAGA